ncbi:MAG: glutaredoxin family protein [Hylemonella sp.]|uniref:glutaredoxin family protein n=1 Tax=Hylemonella sp. TaxID=2066020 RepID=UPI0022CC136A|nr:glutaredoxin family protein [Hylemonella sp.]MCZ8251394.1 glutaredoxin family protein [Hylemonella sp.]
MKNAYRPHRTALLAVAATLALLPALVPAQAIYRIVGPDGRVTFSDKPPTASEKATALSASGRSAQAAGAAELPFELREAMNRYPVTLYTGDNCEPCNAARNLLTRRGVPYTERTITTAQDIDALKRLGMEATVPSATIGGQRLKGYAEGEWEDYLNAAGYPTSSRLPSTYRNAPASPLAPVAEAAPARPAAAAPAPAPATLPPPGPTPTNPTGIVF